MKMRQNLTTILSINYNDVNNDDHTEEMLQNLTMITSNSKPKKLY